MRKIKPTNRFQIKVCGITSVRDARLVVDMGGDMIGLIFYKKSPRFVSKLIARKIIKSIPPLIDRVGVFVDQDIDSIIKTAHSVSLDYVQIHGIRKLNEFRQLKRNGIKVIQAVSDDFTLIRKLSKIKEIDLILIDNQTTHLQGGTGMQFDWSLSKKINVTNLMLAGGISKDNVGKGVKLFKPSVVDVNSAVEHKPGYKSKRRLKEFFDECNRIRYGI